MRLSDEWNCESQRIRNDLIKAFLDPQYLDNMGKALLEELNSKGNTIIKRVGMIYLSPTVTVTTGLHQQYCLLSQGISVKEMCHGKNGPVFVFSICFV